MRDQTNIIVTVVAVLLGIIGVTTLWFTKPEPQPVLPIEPVPLAAAKLPEAEPLVVRAPALPNAGSGGASQGAPSGFGGLGGGRSGFGAPGGPGGPGIPGGGKPRRGPQSGSAGAAGAAG